MTDHPASKEHLLMLAKSELIVRAVRFANCIQEGSYDLAAERRLFMAAKQFASAINAIDPERYERIKDAP